MIAYTLDGQGSFCDETGVRTIDPGTVWIHPYGKQQDYWTDDRWFYVWFHVEPVAEPGGLLPLTEGVRSLRPTRWGEAIRKAAELYLAEAGADETYSTQLRSQYGEAMVMYLRRELECDLPQIKAEQRARLFRLWQDVMNDYAHPWSLAELAECCHLSVPQFNRVVIEHEGMPPMKKVTQLRIQQACHLLDFTSYPLDAIAGMLGYSTAYALSKVFKRTMGVAPGKYRRRTS